MSSRAMTFPDVPEAYLRMEGVMHTSRHEDLAPTFSGNTFQLGPEGLNLFLVSSDQRCLINNFIALCCDLNLLGSCRKLEGVVSFLCLTGCWGHSADDRNASTIACQ